MPPFMAGMALIDAEGKKVCFSKNHPSGDMCPRGAACNLSHACPVYKGDGTICGSRDHRGPDCPRRWRPPPMPALPGGPPPLPALLDKAGPPKPGMGGPPVKGG